LSDSRIGRAFCWRNWSRSKLIHAGCWAHARRYFFQAVEAHPDDRAAIALVATIDELFAIDAQAREENLTVIEGRPLDHNHYNHRFVRSHRSYLKTVV
jgi:hypothetical protein